MIRAGIFILLMLLLQSCAGLRIVTDGTAIPPATLPKVAEPMVVVGRFDSLRIGYRAVLLGTTTIKAPTQSFSYSYLSMVEICKREAQRLHGNVIEILDYGNVLHNLRGSTQITANIYSMDDPWFKDMRQQMQAVKDQEKELLKDKIIVHLKFHSSHAAGFFPITCQLYLNKTKVFKFNDHTPPLAGDGATTLTFTEPGYLSIGPEILSPHYMKVMVVKGQEYFISVSFDHNDNASFREVNKDYFMNDL